MTSWRSVSERLLLAFGPQGWWPAQTVWEVVVGAVLAQGTSWRNAERAIARLRAARLLDPEAMAEAGRSGSEGAELRLLDALRPSGYFRRKADRLLRLAAEVERYGSLAGWLDAAHRLKDEELRRRFLALSGVGPETADSLLLYAAGRPTFVADAYARRIGERLGLLGPGTGYEAARRAALSSWRPSPGAAELAEAHALLVELAKRHCRKREPDCRPCPLLELCPTGSARVGAARGASARPHRRPGRGPG